MRRHLARTLLFNPKTNHPSMPHLKDKIGFTDNGPAIASPAEENRLREFVNLKLAARGYPIVGDEADYPFLDLGKSLIANFQEKSRLLSDYLCPADASIEAYLRDYLGDEIVSAEFPEGARLLPTGPLIMERHGIARMLSLPPDKDEFKSSILSSYRCPRTRHRCRRSRSRACSGTRFRRRRKS